MIKTKYRHRILNPGVRGYLSKLFPKVVRSMAGCEIVSYNMQVEHIHMVMIIPPKYSVSEVIGRIKGQTASRMRKKFGWLKEVYWNENVVLSPGVKRRIILRYWSNKETIQPMVKAYRYTRRII